MVEQVGDFARQRSAVAGNGVNDGFDGLLSYFLRNFWQSLVEQRDGIGGGCPLGMLVPVADEPL